MRIATRRRRLLAITAAWLAAVPVGCSGSEGRPTSTGSTVRPTSTLAPVASTGDGAHPASTSGFGLGPVTGPCVARPVQAVAVAWLPLDLPLPEGTYAISELPGHPQFRRVVLAAPRSYSEFAQFALAQWPRHGWRLGLGENEIGEAEDGFVRATTYGAFRARQVYCEAGWSEVLLALGGAVG